MRGPVNYSALSDVVMCDCEPGRAFRIQVIDGDYFVELLSSAYMSEKCRLQEGIGEADRDRG